MVGRLILTMDESRVARDLFCHEQRSARGKDAHGCFRSTLDDGLLKRSEHFLGGPGML